MYAVAIVLTFLGIAIIIAYLGMKLKSYPIMKAFFYFISFYFIILCLGSLLIISNENLSGDNGDKMAGLIETTYAILQTIFIWIVMPLFLLGIIFDALFFIYKQVSRKEVNKRRRSKAKKKWGRR